MRATTDHMEAGEKRRWSERIRRLEGVVFYRVVEEQAKRMQVLRNQHRSLSRLIAESDASMARVQVAEDTLVTGVATDFVVLENDVQSLLARVETARTEREELLAGAIRGRLQDEMRRVEQYLLVTRIAIARATDQLAMAGDEVQP